MGRKTDVSGLTALVTGASSGIGLEFCRVLARRGCNLVMVSNQEEELRLRSAEIKKEFNVRADTLAIDLTEPNAARNIDSWLDTHRIDPEILINNAGIFSFNTIGETSQERINCFIDLHVRAVTTISRRFARRFRSRGRGWMLNMSSMSCWMPMPGLAMYSATKAYIRVFSRSLNYELRDAGIGVTVACPGGIATDLFGLPENLKRLAVSIGVLQTPERFASKAVDRMMRRRKQYINGWLNRISILFVGIMPTPVRMLVKHKLLDRGIRR